MVWLVGFLLGTRQTILEIKDGGPTWVPRPIPSAEEKESNYRFNSISFRGKESWIVGKPAILLHTSDAGETGRGSIQLVHNFQAYCQPHNQSVARRIQKMSWETWRSMVVFGCMYVVPWWWTILKQRHRDTS